MVTSNSFNAVGTIGPHLYRSSAGQLWDTQPACFWTDYLMGSVSLGASFYVAVEYFKTREQSHRRVKYIWWYLLCFLAVATTSGVGGVLHHMLHLTVQQIGSFHHHRHHQPHLHPQQTQQNPQAEIFGLLLARSTIDVTVEWLWNVTLTTSIVVDFALFALAAHQYLDHKAHVLRIVMTCAIGVYLVLIVMANIWLETYFMLIALVPAMVLGFGTSWHALGHQHHWIRRRARNELVMFGFILASAVTMALELAPSKHYFNHNALAHVLMSIGVVFAAFNFALEKQGPSQIPQSISKKTK